MKHPWLRCKHHVTPRVEQHFEKKWHAQSKTGLLKWCGGANCTSWSIRIIHLLLFASVVRHINLQAHELPLTPSLAVCTDKAAAVAWSYSPTIWAVWKKKKKKKKINQENVHFPKSDFSPSLWSQHPLPEMLSPVPFTSGGWWVAEVAFKMSHKYYTSCHGSPTSEAAGSLPGIFLFPRQLPTDAAASRFKLSSGCTEDSSVLTSQLWYSHSVLFQNWGVTHAELPDLLRFPGFQAYLVEFLVSDRTVTCLAHKAALFGFVLAPHSQHSWFLLDLFLIIIRLTLDLK